MSARGKSLMALGCILLLAGTAMYFGTRHSAKERNRRQTQAHKAPVPQQQGRATPIVREAVDSIPTSFNEEGPILYGRVTDEEGSPLAGVTVEAGVFEGASLNSLAGRVFVQSTMTDEKGEFRFPRNGTLSDSKELLGSDDGAPEERLHSLLVASKEGWVAERRQVDLQAPSGPHWIVLKKDPSVGGQVIWEETLEPVGGVKVVCTPRKHDIYQHPGVQVRTDNEGSFRFTVSAEGTAWIRAVFTEVLHKLPPGYTRYDVLGRGSVDITLIPGEEIENVVLMIERGSDTVIEGRVMDEGGGPVAGARVQLSMDRSVSHPTLSRKDGHYRLIVPKNWPYQSYFLEDWPDKPEVVFLRAGRNVVAKPVHGPYLESLIWTEDIPPDERPEWKPRWTPPPHAPPERLVAFHPDYEIGIVKVSLLGPAQMRRGTDIVLCQGSRISGKVLDESSCPLEGAEISVSLDPEQSPVLIKNDYQWLQLHKTTSARDGSFDIRFLREGSYELTASHEACAPVTKHLELQAHQVAQGFDFVLVRGSGFIRGRVLDKDGNPWPHGNLMTHVSDGTRFVRTHRAEVKEDGSYDLSGLEPGQYNLWLEVAKDYPQPEGILEASGLEGVPADTEGADIVVRESAAGALRVRVVDQSQQPLGEFVLKCRSLSVPYRACGITEEKYSGIHHVDRRIVSESCECLIEKVIPGKYRVTVTARGYGTKSAEVEIGDWQEVEAPFMLEKLEDL